jgi:hypothetical protein
MRVRQHECIFAAMDWRVAHEELMLVVTAERRYGPLSEVFDLKIAEEDLKTPLKRGQSRASIGPEHGGASSVNQHWGHQKVPGGANPFLYIRGLHFQRAIQSLYN